MNNENQIQEFFDDVALGRSEFFLTYPNLAYEQNMRAKSLFAALDPQAEEFILDAGCGHGADLIPLLKKKCRCAGIDLSENMIAETKKELKRNGLDTRDLTLSTGDITRLAWPDAVFDKVFASEIIEHVPDYPKAIAELSRVLKPGGTLVITTPNRKGIYAWERYLVYERILKRKWPHPYDEWKTYEELKPVFAKNNLKIVYAASFCFMFGGALFVNRYPMPLKKMVIWITSCLEPILSRLFPLGGYSLCLKAIKE